MRRAVLLGNPDTKRTNYLEKAAAREGLSIVFVDWESWKHCQQLPAAEALLVKIDPPLWTSCSLAELSALTEGYIRQLEVLESYAQGQNIFYLNTPSAIAGLLDKRACKERLRQAGLSVTETIQLHTGQEGGRVTAQLLIEEMRRQHVYQVFIKPVMGSGAAGVSALRLQPMTGQLALYSCALMREDGALVNTKRLRRFSRTKEVLALLDQLLALDCVVERWYAKAAYQGYSYDLRAVVQDGGLDYLLGRLSRGPITNLHLNNQPVEAGVLGLSSQTREEIEALCCRSMELFPGLRSAGIDILLERGSMKPHIIEMNAQGDLIYQDIYNENRIYVHQVQMMRNWLRSV